MPADDFLDFAHVHLERNRLTRNDWESFARHRHRITELLIGAAPGPEATLCVLGAGNGNDLDLASLAERYEQIALVDLDGEALAHCLDKQAANVAAPVETVAGVDLSGLRDLLEEIDEDTKQIDAAIERAQHPRVTGLATYDVVVSTCVLTQIIDSAVRALGPRHPQIVSLTLALRDGHIRLMDDLTVAGGTALLITDFVSSDTLPELKGVPDADLETLLARAINAGNFFTGVNPGVLRRRLADPTIFTSAASVKLHPPWRWQLGHRTLAVCAVEVTREV